MPWCTIGGVESWWDSALVHVNGVQAIREERRGRTEMKSCCRSLVQNGSRECTFALAPRGHTLGSARRLSVDEEDHNMG